MLGPKDESTKSQKAESKQETKQASTVRVPVEQTKAPKQATPSPYKTNHVTPTFRAGNEIIEIHVFNDEELFD